tara:strand:+ start:176 stop:466 length:291 start_codon:yes stop_codon:yes gene_type:complete
MGSSNPESPIYMHTSPPRGNLSTSLDTSVGDSLGVKSSSFGYMGPPQDKRPLLFNSGNYRTPTHLIGHARHGFDSMIGSAGDTMMDWEEPDLVRRV